MDRTALRADLLLLLTAVVWGFAFVAQRLGMQHVGPFAFNGVRFLLGAVALLPLTHWLRRVEGVRGFTKGAPLWQGGMLLGVILFGGASLQQLGMVYTTSGKAGFITGLYVVLVPVLGLVLRQRAGVGTWAGAVVAALGLYLLSVTGEMAISKGDLLVLLGALFWAAHVLVVGALTAKRSAVQAMQLAVLQFAVCGTMSLLVALVAEPLAWSGAWGAAPAILYGGLVSVGVGYTLQLVAQRHAKPAHAAILLSLEAVFAALGGYWLLQEELSLRQMVGCGLMLAGMVVSQLVR